MIKGNEDKRQSGKSPLFYTFAFGTDNCQCRKLPSVSFLFGLFPYRCTVNCTLSQGAFLIEVFI